MQCIVVINLDFLSAIPLPFESGFIMLFHIHCLIKIFGSLTNLKDFIFKQRCRYEFVVQDMYFVFLLVVPGESSMYVKRK